MRPPSLASISSPWVICLALASLSLNITPWDFQPVSPATLIYAIGDAWFPVFVSPFIITTWLTAISRIVQLGWIVSHLSSLRTGPAYLTGAYASLLVARCASGFLFSRSIGWAYPSLFSHTALYEPTSGLGPLLVGSILFDDLQDAQHILRRLVVLSGLSLMDNTPWSYMCATVVAGVFRLVHSFCAEEGFQKYAGLLPSWFNTDVDRDQDYATKTFHFTRPRIIAVTLLATTVCGLSTTIPYVLHPMRLEPTTAAPGVHIIMLTVPRTRNLSSDVMIESISSYARPWIAQLSAGVPSKSALTVFAHLGVDGMHPAFERAKTHFTPSAVPMTFHMQPIDPDGLTMNHYVQLADAVQYAYEMEREWTMFVEDDFVLCGQWGWDNLSRIMARLGDPAQSRLNGAFIGTGGSGLIFHRSVLPTLRNLLLLVADLDKAGTAHPNMPPDVLLQACMSGEQSFCPKRGWAISSRLLMGHRGWDVSTGDRVYTKEMWACRWRHPQHGMKGAEVVVV